MWRRRSRWIGSPASPRRWRRPWPRSGCSARPTRPSSSMFGLRAADAPSWCPGRVHLVDRGLEAQVADPGPLADAVARLSTRWPRHVASHPASVRCPTTSRWTTCSSCRRTTTSCSWASAMPTSVRSAWRCDRATMSSSPGRPDRAGPMRSASLRSRSGAPIPMPGWAPCSHDRPRRSTTCCSTSSDRGWTSSTSRPTVTRSSSSTTPSSSTTLAVRSRRAWHASTPRSMWSPPLGPTRCVRATATGPSWCGAAGWASC